MATALLPGPRAGAAPPGGPPAPGAASAWEGTLGPRWRLHVVLLLALCAAAGALRPLADPDLPMHLATGEWVARHGVPRAEPFAWTRPGAPFFALPWAPQLVFYEALAAGGPAALRLLDGLLLAAAGAAVGALGRAARWAPAVTLAVAAGNVLAAAVVSIGLRPQTVMFALVPLAWAAAFAAARRPAGVRGARAAAPYAALLAASAAAVNTHLYFPLLLAPVVALAAAGDLAPRRALVAGAAVVAGWFATPYASDWPAMLRFMLTPYALFRPPVRIRELQPGFVALLQGAHAGAFVAAPLLAVPWALGRAGLTARERLVAAVYWTAGCVLFAAAARGVAVWWLVTLPFAARALDAAGGAAPARRPAPAWLRRAVLAGGAACVALAWADGRADRARDGTLATRRLSLPQAAVLDPIAAWLRAHARPGAGGRVLTTFDYGSYLTWTLPGYSASADSRGSLPDSALAPEVYAVAWSRTERLGPWRSADLAVVPTRWRLAAVLDTARGWRRVGTAAAGADSAGLWVRDAWWRQAGAAPLAAAPLAPAAAGTPR